MIRIPQLVPAVVLVLAAPSAPGQDASSRPGAARDVTGQQAVRASTGHDREPPLDPRLLGLAAGDIDGRIGIALVRAREGDLDGALVALRAIAAPTVPEPYAGRIAREIERLAAVVALRDGWLAALAAKRGRIQLELGGQEVEAAVQRIEGGAIVLAPNKAGIASVPIAALRLEDILRGTAKREFQAGSEPWARGYLALMAGDAKSEKLLAGDAPALRDLREDARVWIGDSVRAGRVARILATLAASPLPSSRAEGEAGVEHVRALMADRDLPSVAQRRALLARYAEASLAAAAGGMETRELVGGRFESAGDEGARLVYEFDQASEVRDFAKHAGYLAALHAESAPLALPEAEARVDVVDGRAVFAGPATWRLPVGFQAPLRVRYTLRFVAVEGAKTAPPSFDLLVCDDGRGGFVRATAFGAIQAVDRSTGHTTEARSPDPIRYFDDRDYDVEVVHDGARVSTRFAGEERAACHVGDAVAGDVVLIVHTHQRIAIERIEIVGRVETASIARTRRAWIERRMVELGF